MASRETKTISFTPEHASFVEELLRSGRYHTASEVIRAGLRLLQDQEQMRDVRLEELRKRIAVGLGQLERGEGIPADQVFDELMNQLERVRGREKRAKRRA